MRKTVLAITCTSFLGLAACEGMTPEGQQLVGGLAGAGAGYLTAQALDADRDWTVISTLAGAGIGVIVARNQQTRECAVHRGGGRYEIVPCPPGYF